MPGDAQLCVRDAVQHVPAGGGRSRGDHVRDEPHTAIGSNLAKLARHPEDDALRRRVRTHGSLLGFFVVGAVTSTVMCGLFSYASLLGALVPLGVVLAGLVRADLFLERGKLDAVPHGH